MIVALGSARQPGRRKPVWAWAPLFAILLFSAWVQWTTASETRFYNAGGPDAASYVSYAYNLREFGIYSRSHTWDPSVAGKPTPDAVSPPGYPLFLTLFLQGPPDYAFMQRVIHAQAALGVLTTLFAFLVTFRVAGIGAASVVGALVAFTPHLATITTSVLTESLFTCLLLASMWAFTCALQNGRAIRWAAAGLLFGACCLVRPTLQLLPFLALAVVALLPRARPYRNGTAIAVAFCFLLLLPWLAYKNMQPDGPNQRNLLRATLYHGSFPGMMYADNPKTMGFAYRFDPHATEFMSSDAALLRGIGARMRAEPLRYLQWYIVGKPRFFLAWDNSAAGAGDAFIDRVADSPFFHRTSFRLMHALMYGLHWPLMLLGIFSALMAILRPSFFGPDFDRRPLVLLAWLGIAAILFHMIGAPYPRYGIPFWPVFYVLGATLLSAFVRATKVRRSAKVQMVGTADSG